MFQYIPRLIAPLSLALVFAACSGDQSEDALATDTSLNRDILLANRDSAAQPSLTDVPAAATPAPSTAAPRTVPRPTTTTRTPTTGTTASGNTVTRTPGASAARVGTIAAGSTLNFASSTKICTNTNRVGERFNATLTQSVSGSNGAVIPQGATATIEVTELKRSENANDEIVMGFRIVSVTFGGRTYPVSATTSYAQVNKVRSTSKSSDVKKVVGGAAIGAIAGQILGKSTKATVIGAAAGGAAGAAAAAATGNYEGCVNSGGRITATLNSATQVQI
ncbi:MAG TPA: hypothetical protein VNO75_02490 [Gemmatimonadaceae bacterium]|nr:hypothetical protein [Gemmatimonadaceae bacterium]